MVDLNNLTTLAKRLRPLMKFAAQEVVDASGALIEGNVVLDDLTDVNAPAPNDLDVLTWNAGAGEWIPQASPAGEVVDASDVTYTPAVLTDWDADADPGGADDALDQLAERVDDLEGASPSSVKQTILTFIGALSISDSPLRIYNKFGSSQTISQVFLSVGTAPVGDSVIVDIHKNGTTIFTNQAHRPVITTGNTSGSTVTIDVSAWADGDYLTAHVDNVGSGGTEGSDLVVHIIHS